MTINTNNSILHSSLSGLTNWQNDYINFIMPSQSLSANEIRIVGTPTVTLDNADSISSIQVNFGNIETSFRPIYGFLRVTIGGPSYDIICLSKYKGTTLTITILIADDTGIPNIIPSIDFNFRINTYKAPF